MLFRSVEVERLPRGPVPPRNPFQAWAGSALPSGGRLRLSVRRRGLFSAAPGVVPERERAGFRGKSGAFLHGSRRITFAVAIVKRPAVMERCRPALLRRLFGEERAVEGASAEKFRCRKILPSEDPIVGRPAGAASSAGSASGGFGPRRLPVGPVFGSAAEHAARSCRVPRSVESYREAGRGATPSEKARRSTGTALRRWPPVRLRAAVRASRLRP